jgi:hypothetical protein
LSSRENGTRCVWRSVRWAKFTSLALQGKRSSSPEAAKAHSRHKKPGLFSQTGLFNQLSETGLLSLSRNQIDGSVLAATIDFEFEFEPVAFVQRGHAGAFDG